MRRLLAGALGLGAVAVAVAAPEMPADLSAINPFAPPGPAVVVGGITPISDVNANNASGLSNFEFSSVTIRGVAQIGVGALDPYDVATPSTWFYVADGTGGVAIAQSGGILTSVVAGDSVEVQTFVFTQRGAPLFGTRALDHGAIFPGTITVLASGLPVDPPVTVTATDITQDGDSWEGTLVTVDALTLVDPSEWPAPGVQGFVRVTDGTTEFQVLIDDETDLTANSPPAGAFNLTGFVAQADADGGGGGPYVDDHYLYPRGIADFAQGDGSGVAAVDPAFVVIGATGVALDFLITGQDATLETIEIAIPASWTWETPGDVTVSGPGFSGATASARPDGGSYVVEVTGAAITAAESGTVRVSSLTAPGAPQTSTFPVSTAVGGGTPTPITSSPQVVAVTAALPGDVVINEFYPITITLSQGIEYSEFVELRNVSGADLALDGWTLQDVGRGPGCDFEARWAFPIGTTLPADGFAVICRAADNGSGRGFLVDFPGFPAGVPLFEMYDPVGSSGSVDDLATPNMVLLDPSAGDDQIILLGGASTNVGQCEADEVPDVFFPFYERVALRDVPGTVIDLVEYREPGPCAGEFCDDGLSPAGAVYPYGPPKYQHTLGRDAASSDTDVSRDDLIPSSNPSPGLVNVPGDTVPPELFFSPGQAARSAVVLQLEYDEPVDLASGLDPANYEIMSGGESLEVLSVIGSPVRFNRGQGTVVATVGRHFFLSVEDMPAGASATLRVSGVTDVVIGASGGNEMDTTVAFTTDSVVSSICRVQEYDENGISPAVGDTVLVAGWVTLGDVPPVAPGEPPPIDRLSIWVQEPDGCGVNVFAFLPDDPVDYETSYGDIRAYGVFLNDFVQIKGVVTEFISGGSGAGAVTEIALLEDEDPYRLLGRGLAGPDAPVLTTHEVNNEDYEGLLVRTEGTVINQNSLAAWIDDGSGACQVFQNFSDLDLTRFIVGDRLDVTGVVTQFDSQPPYLGNYELIPQSQDAIFKVDEGFSQSPQVRVEKAVLVPDLGERITIETISPQRSHVIVEIWDTVGRRVLTLYDGVGLGTVVFEWDGRDMRGKVVEPGTYLCRVRSSRLDGGVVENHTAPIVVGLRLEGGGPR